MPELIESSYFRHSVKALVFLASRDAEFRLCGLHDLIEAYGRAEEPLS